VLFAHHAAVLHRARLEVSLGAGAGAGGDDGVQRVIESLPREWEWKQKLARP
jgi:hypothetical protein